MQLVYKPHHDFLGLFGQHRAVGKKQFEYFLATFKGGFLKPIILVSAKESRSLMGNDISLDLLHDISYIFLYFLTRNRLPCNRPLKFKSWV